MGREQVHHQYSPTICHASATPFHHSPLPRNHSPHPPSHHLHSSPSAPHLPPEQHHTDPVAHTANTPRPSPARPHPGLPHPNPSQGQECRIVVAVVLERRRGWKLILHLGGRWIVEARGKSCPLGYLWGLFDPVERGRARQKEEGRISDPFSNNQIETSSRFVPGGDHDKIDHASEMMNWVCLLKAQRRFHYISFPRSSRFDRGRTRYPQRSSRGKSDVRMDRGRTSYPMFFENVDVERLGNGVCPWGETVGEEQIWLIT